MTIYWQKYIISYMETKELITYIQISLKQGLSKEEIYLETLKQGWKVEQIEKAFNPTTSPQAEPKHVEPKHKEQTQKRVIQIIITIAVILIGAGIFSFIAANWQEMDKPLKIFIIVIAMLGSYIGGWFLKEKYSYHKTGEALILLGSLIYGAGIFLVAQMFHIRANWPDGFILWMIGTIGLAWVVESFPLYLLGVVLGIVAIVGHPFAIFQGFSGHNPFLLTSSFLLLMAAIITFITGWLIKKRLPKELKEFY